MCLLFRPEAAQIFKKRHKQMASFSGPSYFPTEELGTMSCAFSSSLPAAIITIRIRSRSSLQSSHLLPQLLHLLLQLLNHPLLLLHPVL